MIGALISFVCFGEEDAPLLFDNDSRAECDSTAHTVEPLLTATPE